MKNKFRIPELQQLGAWGLGVNEISFRVCEFVEIGNVLSAPFSRKEQQGLQNANLLIVGHPMLVAFLRWRLESIGSRE